MVVSPKAKLPLCTGSTPRICEEVAQALTMVVCVELVPTLAAWSKTRARMGNVPAFRAGYTENVALPLVRMALV